MRALPPPLRQPHACTLCSAPPSAMPRLHVHAILCRRLEREDGIVARFVIGHSADARKEAAVDAEAAKHGDMLRLDLVEGYGGLPAKTVAFLRVGRQAGWGHAAAAAAAAAALLPPSPLLPPPPLLLWWAAVLHMLRPNSCSRHA